MSDLSFETFAALYGEKKSCFGEYEESFSNDECVAKLYKISDRLIDNAKKFNLTSITEPEEIVRKHIIDSILPIVYIKRRGIKFRSLLDVGTGAGFPLLPMAAAVPEAVFTGLDATGKKIAHITETAEYAEMGNVAAVKGRAEEEAHGKLRGRYDIVTARAVADLPVLMELCAAFAGRNGYFIALKSDAADEIKRAEKTAVLLGLSFEGCDEYTLPGGDSRCVVVYRRVKETPAEYPRRYAEIIKGKN